MNENVFHNKNFVLTFLGAAVSNIGAILYNFAVGFWILELTDNDAFMQGAYLAATGLSFVLFSMIGGVLCDRFHKGKVMFVCDYLRGGLIVVSALLILSFGNDGFAVAVLFVSGILGNLIGAVFSPASTALLPNILKEEKLLQANSYMSVLSSFQSIVGAVLAAALYAAMPTPILLLLVGVCYLCSGVSEMFIRYEEPKATGKLTVSSAVSDLKDGVGYVFGNKSLFALVGVCVMINFFFSPIMQNFFPYFLKTDVAGHDYLFSSVLTPESWNSVISVSLGVASILFGILISNQKQKKKVGTSAAHWTVFLAAVVVAMAVGYELLVVRGLGLNVFLILLCVGAFLIGMALTYINIPITTVIQIITDKDKLGKVSAVLNTGSQGLIPVGVFLAGIVVDRWGCFPLLCICSLGVAATALFALKSKNYRSL